MPKITKFDRKITTIFSYFFQFDFVCFKVCAVLLALFVCFKLFLIALFCFVLSSMSRCLLRIVLSAFVLSCSMLPGVALLEMKTILILL